MISSSLLVNNVRRDKVADVLGRHELQRYLDVAGAQLSIHAKIVMAYLLDNPGDGAEDLLAIMRLPARDESIVAVKDALRALNRYERLKELPVFQTVPSPQY